MEDIVLIGFMGAGETTVGQSLADKLKMPHLDSDTALIERIGCSVPDYFEKYGKAAFRRQEAQLLKGLSKNIAVLSTGGGIVVGPENRGLLGSFQQVVYLHAIPEELLRRIAEDTESQRPLAIEHSSKEVIISFGSHKSLYEEYVKMTIDMTNHSPEEIINGILQ